MNNVIKVNFLKRKAPSSLLGLSLDGSRLEGAVLRRHNGSLQVNQRFAVTLTLDPLTNDPELVGREILNHLQAAGVRERNCVAAVPLKWVLAAHTKVPKLPAADLPSFLQIEAERGFPTDPSTLQMATSRFVSPSGEDHATFIGVPRGHVERLEQVLRAAKLKPVSFSIGLTALQPTSADPSTGVMAFVIGESHVGVQITYGGGVAALRALEGAVATEGADRVLQSALVSREARITLGQLPEDLRDGIKRIRIFGPRKMAEELAAELRPRFESSGIRIEVVATYPTGEFSRTIPPETPASAAFSLAARQLIGRSDPFEFLPPKISAWQRLSQKYASGKLRAAGAAAAAVLLIVIGMFAFQQWQLNRLRNTWSGMQAKVKDLTLVQDQIQKYRPWYDDSHSYLKILKELTMAFPEDGAVTAKTVEIRDANTVLCSGNAQNIAVLLKMVHNLGGAIEQTRGKSPVQFTLNFHPNGKGANED